MTIHFSPPQLSSADWKLDTPWPPIPVKIET
eukprot:CAMPEP_0118637508 /NCGR_PEP_ID=MMETSP0785-20121206/3186_1 /TAXON_ID=91992 /ORGANISM="Bolidomonas pacifica, Strain CCMP 1866" /LENGTH=30 /DNA_ID= /DNA_START= /DNA_END= /DNA_ORIENTATION=